MTTPKPRYCMVVHAHYPIGEPRVEREAEALIENGYEVDVLCLRNPSEPPQETIGGVNIYRLPVKRHKKRGVAVQFLEYLAFFTLVFLRLTRYAGRYHIVHVHNLPDFLVFSALIPRLRGAWIILDIHDLMPEFFLSRFRGGGSRWLVGLLNLQERLACRFAHFVITVSEPWRKTLIERGVTADKSLVVMNVAGTTFTQAIEQTQTEPIRTNNTDFHLFYHGTLAYRYGIDLALQAVAKIYCELPDFRFTIHGRGEYLDSLQGLTKELNLNDIVTFSTQYVPTKELPQLIASANIGIVPYRRDIFTDGILPTKLMEYAALKIPAIVARTSGISAYFHETMVEFFISEDVDDLALRIKTLYHNRSRMAELAHNIQDFNQKYSWTTQKTKYINWVNKLTENQI